MAFLIAAPLVAAGIWGIIDILDQRLLRSKRRRRVTTLSDLRPADHIAWQRTLYWHHAIVIEVRSSKVKVIEYTTGESGPKYVVKESWVSVDLREHELFVFDYAKGFEADKVLRCARERLGEANYNPIFNNCEHFATWAKTGVGRSDQVEQAREVLLPGSRPMRNAQGVLEDPYHENERRQFRLTVL